MLNIFEELDYELVNRCKEIRHNTFSNYDHRKCLPELYGNIKKEVIMSEEFRLFYACFKRKVAQVLKPRTIMEFGIGIGMSAMAFMSAMPESKFMGFDNDSDYPEVFSVKPSEFVGKLLTENGYHNKIFVRDTFSLSSVPYADLVHIDACHDFGNVISDVTLAWDCGAEWILVDDCKDSTVSAAVLAALKKVNAGDTFWAYFEDTWTGNILVHHRRNVG